MTKTPKELAHRFHYMFTGRNIGISIARGWLPLFTTLCEQIDELLGDDKLGFHWVQCKEKFGSARFYWEAENYAPMRLDLIGNGGVLSLQTETKETGQARAAVLGKISALVFAAEMQTQKICICCGQPAAKPTAQDGYYLVLCQSHAQAWVQGGDLEPSPWFDATEDSA